MAIKPGKATGGEQKKMSMEALDGTYEGRLVQVLDLGLQKQKPWDGKEVPPKREIMLTYELSDEFMKDEDGEDILDKPRWISETIPFASFGYDGKPNEKARSTKRYKVFDPEEKFGWDLTFCAGQPCSIEIKTNEGKNGKLYSNVKNVGTLNAKKAAKLPDLVNPTAVFDLDEPDMEVFNKLPEWIREKICSNLEFQGSALEKALNGKSIESGKDDDDLPF